MRWLQENTFAPKWLPEQLRHPLIGYLVAGLIEGMAVTLIMLLLFLFPSFAFHGIVTVAGVVLVALGWGAGPALFATLVGTFLIYYVILPPHFSWILTNPADGIGLVMYLAVGAGISLLAGRNERARQQAEETAQLLDQAESRSRIDAEYLHAVLEVLPAAVMIAGNQGEVLVTNHASRTLWGTDVDRGTDITRYAQDNPHKVLSAGSGQPLSPAEWPLIRALASGDAVLNNELEIEGADGQRKVLLTSATPIRDELGAMTGAVMLSRDVTERRRLESKVAERAQELDAIFETMTDGVFVFDAEGHTTHLNAVARTILGPAAAHLGKPMRDRIALQHPLDEGGQPFPLDEVPSVRVLRGEVLTGAQAVDVYLPTPQGRTQVLSVSGTPLRTAAGTISGAVVLTHDVTERRRLEREASERAQELEAIFEAMTDGIAVLDADGKILRTNLAFRALHGVEEDSDYLTLPLQQRLATLAPIGGQGQPVPMQDWPVTQLLRGNSLTGVDISIKNVHGREVVFNVSGAPMHDETGHITGCVEVFRDVTQRQHLEQRTHETLVTLVAMAESMVQIRPPTPSLDERRGVPSTVAADTALPLVARRLAELTVSVLGCRRVSLVAVDPPTGHLLPITEVGLHPGQEQAWWASWSPLQELEERFGPDIASTLLAGVPARLDRQHLPERSWYILFGAQSGRIVPMRLGEELVGVLVVDYQDLDHDYAREDESLLTTTLARLGALVLERDRLLRGWAETRASELALAETKVQMDTFLGIASHELKTPLTSLKLSLQLSERRLRRLILGESGPNGTDGEAGLLQGALEQLSRTGHQVQRIEALVNDLVDVSRIQAGRLELRKEQTDLVLLVREAVEVQREATHGRSIQLQHTGALTAPVSADAGRIEQVVTNYLTNALKYSPPDRPVEVGITIAHQQARVWVRDHGPGLPMGEQERIWERFHRVQGVEVQSGTGVGLGLGLYISRMIVERHQGQVGVESIPGQGATFWFTLPLSSSVKEGR
jgi:PAS domain S-box-containing protein